MGSEAKGEYTPTREEVEESWYVLLSEGAATNQARIDAQWDEERSKNQIRRFIVRENAEAVRQFARSILWGSDDWVLEEAAHFADRLEEGK